MQVQRFPQKTNDVMNLMAGMAVNLLGSVIFLICAALLTASNPISTYVLSWAPLIQGVLIAVPTAGAFRWKQTRRWLAVGLSLGSLLQVSVFMIWHAHWLQRYAG